MDTMEIVMAKSNKKKYLILLLVMLALSAITAGIYLFVKPNINISTSYTVDKYPDVVEWCDARIEEDTLSVNCKALLINIDLKGCFEVQVITKNKELENLQVCEGSESLSYTNDVLRYKMLMPLDIVLTYSKEGTFNDYSFRNVAFSKVDDIYVQNIVNEDISNLVSIDTSTTTIQNSVDFCPKPEKLPDYINNDIKSKYTEYKNSEAMEKSKYLLPIFSEMAENQVINENFLICDSSFSSDLGICSNNLSANSSALPKEILTLRLNGSPISWGNDIDQSNIANLNRATAIYDGLLQNNSITYELIYNFNSYIENLSELVNPNEKNICIAHKIFNAISNLKPSVKQDMVYIENLVNRNVANVTSSICYDVLDINMIDPNGLYLKFYFSNTMARAFEILERCNNLSQFTK